MRRWRVLVVVASVAAVWGAGALAGACAAGAGAVPAARAAFAAATRWLGSACRVLHPMVAGERDGRGIRERNRA